MADVGRVAAVMAALAALWSFLPRQFPVPNVRVARDRLLPLDADDARLRLLDTEIRMVEDARRLLDRKARRLKLAMSLLVVAVIGTATAGLLS